MAQIADSACNSQGRNGRAWGRYVLNSRLNTAHAKRVRWAVRHPRRQSATWHRPTMPRLAHTGHDDLVTDDPNHQDFVLTIADVFTLTGRGTAVIGPIESGILRTATRSRSGTTRS